VRRKTDSRRELLGTRPKSAPSFAAKIASLETGCRVPFIQMADIDFQPQFIQEAPAPHSQHDFLQQPLVLSSVIQMRRNPAVPGAVLWIVAVEQQQLYPSHARYPDSH
jgi:hypothetical protein